MTDKPNPWKNIPPVDESKLVCKIGDVLVVRRSEPANEGEGKEIRLGSKYKVVGRVYYGWDLDLIEGAGPSEVRVLNSELLSSFELKQDLLLVEQPPLNNPRLSFPAADLLFGGYFHQDYEGAPEDVVTLFVREQTRKQCEQTIREIESILRQHPDEDSLERIVDSEFRNSFDVLRFKASYRVWLLEIVETIRKACKPSSQG